MNLLSLALPATKILGGIFGHRAAKRQAQNRMLQASITSNLAQSNILRNATAGYGKALVAANRAGGFSPGAFSSSFSNLATDLWQTMQNRNAQDQQALATASAGRMSLLNGALGAFSDLATGYRDSSKTIPGAATPVAPAPYLSKFLDQDWIDPMANRFVGRTF
jgi:hypothetical protein